MDEVSARVLGASLVPSTVSILVPPRPGPRTPDLRLPGHGPAVRHPHAAAGVPGEDGGKAHGTRMREAAPASQVRGANAVQISVPSLFWFMNEDSAGFLALGQGTAKSPWSTATGTERRPRTQRSGLLARQRFLLLVPPPAYLAPADSPTGVFKLVGVRNDGGNRAIFIKNFYFKYIFCREKIRCLQFLLEQCQLQRVFPVLSVALIQSDAVAETSRAAA